MLVKFLSFCATVLGTARYKAILVSCLVLVMSLTGISAVAFMKGGSPTTGAASTVKEEQENPVNEEFAPQLGARRQSPKEAQPQAEAQATPPEANPSAPQTPETTAPTTEINLSESQFVLVKDSQGTNSRAITATTSDTSKVTWTVTPEASSNGSVRVDIAKSEGTQATFTFHVKAEQNAVKDSKHTFTVTAKDIARNIDISRQITVTIQ